MPVQSDAYRRFQEELAALDRKAAAEAPAATPKDRMAAARKEFLALRDRYGLSIADVVSFFPEEEGIGYLQQLIAALESPSRRSKKPR